jgi:hypothetical protein
MGNIEHDDDPGDPIIEAFDDAEIHGVEVEAAREEYATALAAFESLREQLRGAVERCAEADRLLRIAYADCRSPEDVPMDVLAWLTDMPGGQ